MNEVLKDKYGMKIGEVKDTGREQVIYDKYGMKLGSYDGKYTYDKYGMKVGEGNLLAALLPRF